MLPIDEMLGDLREVLEAFDKEPTEDSFDLVVHETQRLLHEAEKLLPED